MKNLQDLRQQGMEKDIVHSLNCTKTVTIHVRIVEYQLHFTHPPSSSLLAIDLQCHPHSSVRPFLIPILHDRRHISPLPF